jgi:hypothetical protein
MNAYTAPRHDLLNPLWEKFIPRKAAKAQSLAK